MVHMASSHRSRGSDAKTVSSMASDVAQRKSDQTILILSWFSF
jgi:hypothetical protein